MKNPSLYFDGECILCNRWVHFFYRLDGKKKFSFIALQSNKAKQDLPTKALQDMTSIVYRDSHGNIYYKSTAILRALLTVHPIGYLTAIFLILPRFFRDIFYDLVAKNRYRWFGKQETCKIDPTYDRSRFEL